ncbi:hypothetical protein PSCLAVI8L_130717 [Pseudoclavibacter sp. 8L]|nr:hypothetical protein PSCLAVI8L_130717 [Pseudoclavibacter sp. 8L]
MLASRPENGIVGLTRPGADPAKSANVGDTPLARGRGRFTRAGPRRASARRSCLERGQRRPRLASAHGFARACGSGEIGRHAGFRFLCFRACGFKSRLPHCS